MNWALALILVALTIEAARHLPIFRALSDVRAIGQKALAVMQTDGVSDHWKEKAMAAYASKMFRATGVLAGLLLALFAGIAGLAIIFDFVAPGYVSFLLGWPGLTFATIAGCGYLIVRQKFQHAVL